MHADEQWVPRCKRKAVGLDTISDRLRTLDLMERYHGGTKRLDSEDDDDCEMEDAAPAKRPRAGQSIDAGGEAEQVDDLSLPKYTVIKIPLSVRAKAFLDSGSDQPETDKTKGSESQALVLYKPPVVRPRTPPSASRLQDDGAAMDID
ncbi:hypothetical protein EC988_005191 [Linderina pennispora]|nr:hypothetical protein EC988_005191 [Linderina pennispora]